MDGLPRFRAEIIAMHRWEMIKNKKRKQALLLVVVVKVEKDVSDSIFRVFRRERGFCCFNFIIFIIGFKTTKRVIFSV